MAGQIANRRQCGSAAIRVSGALLDRGAGYAAIAAIDAAIAGFGPQDLAATAAFIEKLAVVDRHGFALLHAALRAGQDRFSKDQGFGHGFRAQNRPVPLTSATPANRL